MSNLIKLIHPVHGLVTKRQTINGVNVYYIIKQWKLKYGQKYNGCKIEVEDIGGSKDYLRSYKKKVI